MSSKSRKRSRTITDDHRADCPFTVSIVSDPVRDERDVGHKAKKRKHDTPEDDGRVLVQKPPFEPAGRFKTYASMRICYAVEPRKQWLDMTRYNSFVLNGVKYYTDDFVYVANEATIERQNSPPMREDGEVKKANEYWVARILEVRASDEHHVYARVYWMYWPEELPPGTLEGKKTVAGRQPYHGQHELVASNHMDVINVVSVVMGVKVKQWIESDDDDIQEALYWRQAFDCRTSQLSSVDLVCRCAAPANPDKTLVGCTTSKCEQWMHYGCLLDDVLTRVYERLGTDMPHKSEKPAVKKETEDDKSADSLSPKVKEEDRRTPPGAKDQEMQDQVLVKQDDETSKATDTPTPAPQSQPSDKSLKQTPAKRGRRRKNTTKKLYEGLFDATLKMNEGPTVWEITDLREGIQGGEKNWTERAHCLLCNTVID